MPLTAQDLSALLKGKAITLPLVSSSKSISAATDSAMKTSLSTDAISIRPWLVPWTKSLASAE
jgi:hypothetical protein